MLKSEVVVGTRTSMTREAIGYNTKVFWCNFTNHQDAGYPFLKNKKVCIREELL